MNETMTAPATPRDPAIREAAEQVIQTTRLDLYAPIHKAVRHMLIDTLGRVGSMDVADNLELNETLGQLDALLELLHNHLAHENDFVHPAIDARQPNGAARTAGDHVEHVHSIGALSAEALALRRAAEADRAPLALRLYRHLALFVAENFQHMHIEETANNAALWAHYTDDELHALHERLLASISESEMMGILRWMVPALAPAERAGLLAGMQQQMPPEAFRGVLGALRPHLNLRAWAKLARALNLPEAREEALLMA
jgi:iron-sulfur cluster repair protein YtfE (RIC family)